MKAPNINTEGLNAALAKQNLPAIAAIVTDAQDNLYAAGFGNTSADGDTSITVETPFAIMSMTKPITSMAIMRLIERGDLALDAPAEQYLPAHAGQLVQASVDKDAGTYTTEPQNQPFTIRQLLAHTSGIGYVFCNEELLALRPESGAVTFPLCHQPGAAWTYGASTQVLGEIIETVLDRSLQSALTELIFEPLGMSNTSYDVRDGQAQVHVQNEGNWLAQPLGPPMPQGDGGLISTAADYAKFLRCLLSDGAPLVSKATLGQMTTNQIGDLFVREMPAAMSRMTHPFPRGSGVDKWGLGFQLHQTDAAGGRHADSYSWCGLYNTYFWVDPTAGIGAILLTQALPLYTPPCLTALDDFERAIYQS